jgi:cysteinyl-tRNA synthetase
MSTKYLGQPFDIHGGGRDLMFPHHENEIAQSEGAFGQPLARYWIHNGLLTVNGEKMSKSLGNYFTIQEILQDHDSVALRHLFLGSHYRNPMDFSKETLQEAGKAADRIYETIDRAERVRGELSTVPDPKVLDAFQEEMDDDFNSPKALALIFDEVRALNRLLDENKNGAVGARTAALKTMCEMLGLLQYSPEGFFNRKKNRWLRREGLTGEQIERWIAERNQARKEKNWQEADRIRQQLLEKGVLVEDTPGGTEWKVR